MVLPITGSHLLQVKRCSKLKSQHQMSNSLELESKFWTERMGPS